MIEFVITQSTTPSVADDKRNFRVFINLMVDLGGMKMVLVVPEIDKNQCSYEPD
jgi:hypothetical protein